MTDNVTQSINRILNPEQLVCIQGQMRRGLQNSFLIEIGKNFDERARKLGTRNEQKMISEKPKANVEWWDFSKDVGMKIEIFCKVTSTPRTPRTRRAQSIG